MGDEHVGMCVVGTWNSTGWMFVLVDKESAYELVDAYERHRLKHNLPWVTVKEAVDGYGILDNVRNGVFPWVVVFKVGKPDVQNVKAVPLQHCVKVPDKEEDKCGNLHRVTVWAADEFEAAQLGREVWAKHNGVELKDLTTSSIGEDENFY